MNTYQRFLSLLSITVCTAGLVWVPNPASISCESETSLQKQSTHESWYSYLPNRLYKSEPPQYKNKELMITKIHTLNTVPIVSRTATYSATPITANQFVLTAYSLDETCTGKSPGMKDYGITASGAPARVGITVAVDPNIIAYGSIVYIDGLGWRIAEDTGGAIKGNHIDVLVNSYTEAIHFGVKRHQHVQIYLPNTRKLNSRPLKKDFLNKYTLQKLE